MNPEPCEECGRRAPSQWTIDKLHVCRLCMVDILEERLENPDPREEDHG